MTNIKLYNYLFEFNPYNNMWYAYIRENYKDFANGKTDEYYSHKDITELIKLIPEK